MTSETCSSGWAPPSSSDTLRVWVTLKDNYQHYWSSRDEA